jgi:aspartate ammonia-lyase
MSQRIERDLLGECAVPVGVYYGIHTQRALVNFPLTGTRVPRRLIAALAMVKHACCNANEELGYLDARRAGAIRQACADIVEGTLDAQFPLDGLQGGAGTSTNMNVNEVIANRANELLGAPLGAYDPVHPIDHVNLHQSTNDVYPTALKIACIFAFRHLADQVALLQASLQRKEAQFAAVVTIGRTEMREAVPITLGAEFAAFADALSRDRWRTSKCEERLRFVNIGGTAVGTGLAAPRSYIFLVIEKLRGVTGLGLARGDDVMGQTAHADAFVETSGILQAHACTLIKLCDDLRLMQLLGEIELPALQAGSSIMPGKVNPVLLEAVIQVGLKAMANDRLVADAASRGTLQICEFLPLVGHAMLESLDMLASADALLARHFDGIAANPAACRRYVDHSETIITAFLPQVGYERAEQLLADFHRAASGVSLREFLSSQLGRDVVDRTLSAESLTALGHR